ncbi:nicotinate (nicotinamide) nucleotide adenylyltransferase [Pseudodesulfovibrio senegalensis]|uniref:Probable nicotinate-nucleotide adenylyltransferase n=1 Tax=Pseudodesulfovibrio senegalensis TaxID=1721087 RepID=A0A6N6N8F1_9BACT|nr:nicotinate (nicotinamide) nucleotide adenylyltransferase [Pseudodesulfovibrio senegalensis]KAB1443257.1 nicotinate (nicotinamide) nucleotide adenylyltransferase [Pseudodesulfovibrio senegalensis]
MKIGLLGGSFNPVHIGHVRMAIEVREALELDRVELVPVRHPPHKTEEGLLPFDLRMDLCGAAIEGVAGLGSNPIEDRRPGPSFTCDTLTCYREEQPESELVFIMGAATFLELESWRRGLELPELSSLAVVNRWTAAEKVAETIAGRWPDAVPENEGVWRFPSGHAVHLIEIPRLDVKAAMLRERWLQRRDISFLVPRFVREMLEDRSDEVARYWGERA